MDAFSALALIAVAVAAFVSELVESATIDFSMADVKVDSLAFEWLALVPTARWARGVLLRLL